MQLELYKTLPLKATTVVAFDITYPAMNAELILAAAQMGLTVTFHPDGTTTFVKPDVKATAAISSQAPATFKPSPPTTPHPSEVVAIKATEAIEAIKAIKPSPPTTPHPSEVPAIKANEGTYASKAATVSPTATAQTNGVGGGYTVSTPTPKGAKKPLPTLTVWAYLQNGNKKCNVRVHFDTAQTAIKTLFWGPEKFAQRRFEDRDSQGVVSIDEASNLIGKVHAVYFASTSVTTVVNVRLRPKGGSFNVVLRDYETDAVLVEELFTPDKLIDGHYKVEFNSLKDTPMGRADTRTGHAETRTGISDTRTGISDTRTGISDTPCGQLAQDVAETAIATPVVAPTSAPEPEDKAQTPLPVFDTEIAKIPKDADLVIQGFEGYTKLVVVDELPRPFFLAWNMKKDTNGNPIPGEFGNAKLTNFEPRIAFMGKKIWGVHLADDGTLFIMVNAKETVTKLTVVVNGFTQIITR